MKILHTVQYYEPSVGGAQEVVKQISEGLVQRGHEVTVATSRIPSRKKVNINGVRIKEFEITGNAIGGMKGEIKKYQDFIIGSKFDVMMNYSAPIWSTDLVFPLLDMIPYAKIWIPCGLSRMYTQTYDTYVKKLSTIMGKYDHLIFHANDYFDINYARQHNFQNFSVIPNGASIREFIDGDSRFREKYHIAEDELFLLTVGSHTGEKGHRLCIDIAKSLPLDKPLTLVIIGNTFSQSSFWNSFLRPLLGAIKGFNIPKMVNLILSFLFGGIGQGCLPECRMHSRIFNKFNRNRRVLLLDPPRADVVEAFKAADLFLFGSNREYSPLVLFEAMAAKTPFISLSCGNASEIVKWGGGGIIAPTKKYRSGIVEGTTESFMEIIIKLLDNPIRMTQLAENGFESWRRKFTWELIVSKYENLYLNLLKK